MSGIAPYRGIIAVVLTVFLFSPCAAASETGPEGPGGNVDDWQVIESSYATIFVNKDVSIRRASKQLDVRFARFDPIEKALFLDKGFSDEERLANKIDIIVRKAMKVLDMRPHGLHINIRIYESDKDLWDTYEDIFKERKTHKAYYIHKYRTVYVSLPNVCDSVMAHEIGHSVIDHYFAILPPPKIRELLASYVDVHLKD